MSTSTLTAPSPPATPATGSRRPPHGLIGTTVVLLSLGLLGAYQVGIKERRPPAFNRGGAFVAGGRTTLGAGTASPDPLPGATFPAGTGAAAASSRAGMSTTGAAPADAGGAGGTPSAATGPAGVGTSSGPGGGTGSPAPGGSSAPAAALPALGTYTYDINGTESVTGFGSRSFPPTMTITAHKAAGLQPYEVDFDLYYSAQHSERDIVAYRPNSVDLDYEAGSIQFGPMTQTDEGSYVPPLSIVPLVGSSLSGSSAAESGGSTSRVEDWTSTVTGTQTVTVQGRPLQCLVVHVHRQTRSGSADQETRDTTYLYSPALHTWVKWTQTMHAQRNYGVTFTYAEQFTATLSGFRAA